MAETGKAVSRVELYLDLVLVVAISELSRLIVDTPQVRTVGIAFGLFVPIWWTWVDFAVLYNRHGADEPRQRLLFLAMSVPVALAAVATKPASHGNIAPFAISLAVTRVMLAAAHMREPEKTTKIGDALRQRTGVAMAVTAIVFIASIWVPSPYHYFVWAATAIYESRVIFSDDREAARRARSEHDLSVMAPSDPAEALDAHHFAERFGLFMIILLGEVVAQAGESADALSAHSVSSWASLAASVALAGALWWIYFDAAADIDLRVLQLSGGSPAMARVIFATGHMVPAFGLLLTSAGVGLLAHPDPPRIAFWLSTIGTGVYITGTHTFMRAASRRWQTLRFAMVFGTYFLAFLHFVISPLASVCVLAAWTAGAAALVSATSPRDSEDEAEDETAPAAESANIPLAE